MHFTPEQLICVRGACDVAPQDVRCYDLSTGWSCSAILPPNYGLELVDIFCDEYSCTLYYGISQPAFVGVDRYMLYTALVLSILNLVIIMLKERRMKTTPLTEPLLC